MPIQDQIYICFEVSVDFPWTFCGDCVEIITKITLKVRKKIFQTPKMARLYSSVGPFKIG